MLVFMTSNTLFVIASYDRVKWVTSLDRDTYKGMGSSRLLYQSQQFNHMVRRWIKLSTIWIRTTMNAKRTTVVVNYYCTLQCMSLTLCAVPRYSTFLWFYFVLNTCAFPFFVLLATIQQDYNLTYKSVKEKINKLKKYGWSHFLIVE